MRQDNFRKLQTHLGKRDYAALWTYFLLLDLFCSIYTKYRNVFFILHEGGGFKL